MENSNARRIQRCDGKQHMDFSVIAYKDAEVVDNKWVFRAKTDATRYKARLVAKEFT